MTTKNIAIILIVLALIGAVAYLLMNNNQTTVIVEPEPEVLPVEPDGGIGDGAEPLEEVDMMEREEMSVIGRSAGGEDIIAYHFGEGDKEVLFIGGVHSGYSPNTTAVANQLKDYLEGDSSVIPEGIMVTIIPELSPDGAGKSGAEGRFNANGVDINRNFDCEWSANAVWQSQQVSGGSAPFSEPEAASLKGYVETYEPAAAVVWFSAEGKVYPSACAGAPSNSSVELAATYATAAGYPAEAEFDAYAITGDMVNWMAKMKVPAISVLLSDHSGSEWTKNKAGIEAILKSLVE